MQQGTMQEPIGCNTEALIVLMAVAQGIFPPLRTYLIEGLLQVKVHDMVIDVDHFCYGSNYHLVEKMRGVTTSVIQPHLRLLLALVRFSRSMVSLPDMNEAPTANFTSREMA